MSVQAVGYRIAAGFPLLFADVGRSLTAAGVPKRDEDRTPTATVVVSAPSEWSFSNETCWYARAFIEAIPTDSPLGGRHYWMLSKTTRLACAYRLGCVTEVDYKAAVDALEARFTEVLASTQPSRAPRPREFAGLIKDGIGKAAAKTDREARDDFGGHEHNDWIMTMTTNGNGSPPQTAPQPAAASGAAPQASGAQQAAPQAGPQAKGPSVATQLVNMAGKTYTFGIGDDGTPYGSLPGTAHIALALRGGKLGLRKELARRYFETRRSAPTSQALADALNVLEGYASRQAPRTLNLRVAGHNGAVYIDTADTQNRVIEINGGTWAYATGAIPAMFRRTELTAPIPDPVRGGDLSKLWRYIKVPDDDKPILLAVLVSALIQPNVPHVILAFLAEHGCAKSFSTRCVVSLIDPSAAPLRMPPRDIDGWVSSANGSWAVALDNLSSIPDWLSDALCRAATGEGHTKRSLFTDIDLTVLRFRRVIIINGIDLGGLREDLTDRLAPVDLVRIKDGDRKAESDLAEAWEQDRPVILGGLLDLAARVHAKLPGLTIKELPRMADFARVLACVDDIRGTKGLEQYRQRAVHLAADTLEADPFIAHMMEDRYSCYIASASDILANVAAPNSCRRIGRARPAQSPPGSTVPHLRCARSGGTSRTTTGRTRLRRPAGQSRRQQRRDRNREDVLRVSGSWRVSNTTFLLSMS